jgi:hypothetical protein
MEYIKTYTVITNGKPVLFPDNYTLVRQNLDGSILISGPRYTAGVLIALQNVVEVHEADDYVMDLSTAQATVQPGQTLKKDTPIAPQPNKIPLIITISLAGAAIYFLYRYTLRWVS